MRVCSKCNQEKPDNFFHKKGDKGKLRVSCKTCDYAYTKAAREKNPEDYLRIQLKKYGLTVADFKELAESQGGSCKICGVTPTYRLCVDHRHDTGKVRGLLCRTCNKAIGQLGDTPEGVKRAYDYLIETH
jgi:hypothetical protein